MMANAHKPADATKPAPTYPRVVYLKDAGMPGYRAVQVKDADAEKALGAATFDTAMDAASSQPPLEQPISQIARTNNEEQWVDGKSQAGAPIATGVIQTAVPVQNVFVQTGVDPATLYVHAILPPGADPGVFTNVTNPGMPMTAAPAATPPAAHKS